MLNIAGQVVNHYVQIINEQNYKFKYIGAVYKYVLTIVQALTVWLKIQH